MYVNATIERLRERALTEGAVNDLESLLKQLLWHHESQAKPNTPQCTRKYHADLASRIRRHVLGEVK